MSSGFQLGRRMFLRGAAGFTLAIPFLPSLSREAKAGDAPFAKNPRFVAIATHHGGVWSTNMFPDAGSDLVKQTYRDYEIRKSTPSLNISGGKASLSRVLTGDSSKFTPSILSKMNLVQGMCLPYYIGHQTGAHLGNYARNDGNGADGIYLWGFPSPTIDQQMAWSSTFYPDITTIKERSLTVGPKISYAWADPANRTGDIQEVAGEISSLQLFNRFFAGTGPVVTTRTPVVDRVMASYQRLRNGNRRLSSADKTRLDEHMERIHELQRKLEVTVSCASVQPPTEDSVDLMAASNYAYDPTAQAKYWSLINDVIAAVFSCGLSRIATLHVTDTFSSYQGDWHQDIAHKCNQSDGVAQGYMADGHQGTFEGVFLDLITKLDAIDEGGVSALDNSLVQWTHECGVQTHWCSSTPLITAGSAAGAIKTGQHLDYRLLDDSIVWGPYGDGNLGPERKEYPGLLYQQWLANVLDVMGVPRDDWADYADNGGYGKLFIGDGFDKTFADNLITNLGEELPWLRS
ncbi:MAG: DUF1552 domain-containing protein [Polyangiaceae bacterium]